MTNYWIVKSEASSYSIDDLKRDRTTLWDHVRNYQARNYLRDGFKINDLVLFHHSNSNPTGLVGLAKVTQVGNADPSQFDKKSDYYDGKATKAAPRWYSPEITFMEKFKRCLTLEELKKVPALKNLVLLKTGNRLSVMPLSKEEFEVIIGLK